MDSPLGKVAAFVTAAWALGDGPWEKWRALWHQTHNLRARLGVSTLRPRETFTLRTTFGSLAFRDNFGDITNLPKLLHQGVYRWRQLPDEGVIVDVGANIGLAAVWFARFNPTTPIYCFEPLPGNVAMIRRNCPRATVVEAAIGAAHGTVLLRVDPDGVMASTIPTAWRSAEQSFPVRTLDDCADEFAWGPVALLKIDAEGMEPEILRGAQRLLPRVARVAAETHGRDGHDTVLRLLGDAGFSVEHEEFDRRTGMVFAVRHGPRARGANARRQDAVAIGARSA